MSKQKKERKPFPEDEVLVVGKYYNVKHMQITGIDGIRYVPVIGEPHKDPQFGASRTHYHVDGRFAGRPFVNNTGQTNMPVWMDEHSHYAVGDLVILRKRCRRLTTGLNLHNPGAPYADWYKTFIGKSCAGRKCPHRGAHMLERDGRLLCPLHNLQGDIEKEVIVERIEIECPNGIER